MPQKLIQVKPIKGLPAGWSDSIGDLVNEKDGLERLARHTMRNGQAKVTDFGSFKQRFKEAWTSSTNERNLFNLLEGQDDILMDIFAITSVQDEVTNQQRDEVVGRLQQRFDIPQTTAEALFKRIRQQEIAQIQQGLLPASMQKGIRERPALAPEAPPAQTIMQRVRIDGRTYTRMKPEPFTVPEQRYIRNNLTLSPKYLTERFNLLFGSRRTVSSVGTKKYRLEKILRMIG